VTITYASIEEQQTYSCQALSTFSLTAVFHRDTQLRQSIFDLPTNPCSKSGSHNTLTQSLFSNTRTMGKPKNKRNNRKSQPQPAWKIRCVCGAREEGTNDNEIWIQCDECQNWQHNTCMGISTFVDEMPESYLCQDCNPDAHQELLEAMDRGERPWEKRRAQETSKKVDCRLRKNVIIIRDGRMLVGIFRSEASFSILFRILLIYFLDTGIKDTIYSLATMRVSI
jgi:hypothetical protein